MNQYTFIQWDPVISQNPENYLTMTQFSGIPYLDPPARSEDLGYTYDRRGTTGGLDWLIGLYIRRLRCHGR
jgi:hypothetical protein